MKLEQLLQQKIAIWGYGLEGKTALNLLLNNNYSDKIVIIDEKNINEQKNNVIFIKENEIEKYNIDVVIKSSGVSFYKDNIQKLVQKGVIITSILNIFLAKVQKYSSIKTIAITGTKGKSTTSTALYHILKNCGYRVALLGNIGVSFLDVYNEIEHYDYFVLELSSYQTTTIKYFVDYGIILNLFREHIQWHKNHKIYYKDKLNLLNYSKIKIVNFDNETIKKQLNISEKDTIYFNRRDNFFVKNGYCYYMNTILFQIKDIKNINGEHIFRNFCSIFNIFKLEKISFNKVIDCLKTFKPLEHRLEIFYKDIKNNIIYVNDSISTIPEATCECLKTFLNNYKNIFLILGGYERQQDFTILLDLIKLHKDNIRVYLIGETGKRLVQSFNISKYFENYDSLVNTIKTDILKLQRNYAVILSPASPSYDMFRNFEERGKIFKDLMLKNN